MKEAITSISFIILVASLLNYIAYALGFELFLEPIYIFVSLLITVILIIMKGISTIDAVYTGTKDLKYVANCFVLSAFVNLAISCFVSKDTGDSAYFWLSYTIAMSSIVFFSCYVGKKMRFFNSFSFGYPERESNKGKKRRRRLKVR